MTPSRCSSKLDVRLWVDVEDRHVVPPPERLRESARRLLHRPRAVRDRLLSPDPVEDEAQVPVGHLVAQKQKVAAAELGRERHGHDRRQLRVPEVVDVVVLGDDEAFPLALGERVDGSVELQQDRPALERELYRVGVGDVDRSGRLTGRTVPEAAALGTGRNVRDDV